LYGSDDRSLGFLVSLCHEVDRVGFAVDLGPAQAPQMDTARRARGVQRSVLKFDRDRNGLRAHRE
jgi:hypothetical protein